MVNGGQGGFLWWEAIVNELIWKNCHFCDNSETLTNIGGSSTLVVSGCNSPRLIQVITLKT